MRTDHMLGITPCEDANWDLMKAAGVGWLRAGTGFPYQSVDQSEHSERFTRSLSRLRDLSSKGFRLLGSTPGPGSSRFDPTAGKTIWKPSLPESAGAVESDSYYAVLRRSCEEIGKATRGLVDYWQIANEPDIDIFRGPLSDELMVRFLKTSAAGVKKANPSARCGINIGELTPRGKLLIEALYDGSGLFDYVGLDGYFGSWQPGGPQNWVTYIDAAHALSGVPVIINEWGYSSLGSSPNAGKLDPTRPYNQDVCSSGAWHKVWKREHTPAEQAEYLGECLRIFAASPHVIGNFFFKWRDDPTCWQCGQPLCPAECAWGMTDVHQAPKPAYHAYRDAVTALFRVK
jgi:hypothetical protein